MSNKFEVNILQSVLFCVIVIVTLILARVLYFKSSIDNEVSNKPCICVQGDNGRNSQNQKEKRGPFDGGYFSIHSS